MSGTRSSGWHTPATPLVSSEADIDLGGGFTWYRRSDGQELIVATALAGSGALGFAIPASVDARLDADALAWAERTGMLSGRRLCSLSQAHSATCAAAADVQAETNVAPTHCPACGASLDPDTTECPFCGTPLPSFRLTSIGEADAIWTRSPDDLLIVRTADCAAVWLVDTEHAHLAMLHVGWRGAADGIVKEVIDTLREQRGDPAGMVAAIGPHIGRCCFEVGPEVAVRFTDIEGAVEPPSVLTSPRQRDDSVSLNLGAILVAQLQNAGVRLSATHLATACTRCFTSERGEPLLHSYRRNGPGGPLMGSIGFLER